MSPEYAIDGLFSVKSDVFSFGVLVLEIVSGRKNRGFNHPDHQHNLLGHVRTGSCRCALQSLLIIFMAWKYVNGIEQTDVYMLFMCFRLGDCGWKRGHWN
jgi:hypothetical protein